jgi:hypothetical protein
MTYHKRTVISSNNIYFFEESSFVQISVRYGLVISSKCFLPNALKS